jgi:hypothetical protein
LPNSTNGFVSQRFITIASTMQGAALQDQCDAKSPSFKLTSILWKSSKWFIKPLHTMTAKQQKHINDGTVTQIHNASEMSSSDEIFE